MPVKTLQLIEFPMKMNNIDNYGNFTQEINSSQMMRLIVFFLFLMDVCGRSLYDYEYSNLQGPYTVFLYQVCAFLYFFLKALR